MTIKVLSGADRINSRDMQLLNGASLGLFTNPTGISSDFVSTLDICAGLKGSKLSVLFAPEHGIRGDKQAGIRVEDETDPILNIPVYSLCGPRKKPNKEILDNVDIVLFDMQDLGMRFYTYMTVMLNMMEACAEHGKTFVVLDRPNPLGGLMCEGGVLQDGFQTSVGARQIPIRTGLTMGEFAKYANDQAEIRCDLRVVPMTGWQRAMEFTETGLPWVIPSPNIPTLDTVRVYAGNCFFEGTNLSEGRGTTKPFEIIGAPWLDGVRVCRELNALNLPGVYFNPIYFSPTFSKQQGLKCGGIQLFVTVRSSYRAVETALHMLHHIQNMYPEHFEWIAPFNEGRKNFIDYVTGSDLVRTSVHEKSGLERIIELWNGQAEEWNEQRRSYFLYA